jgi:hypothetical protein
VPARSRRSQRIEPILPELLPWEIVPYETPLKKNSDAVAPILTRRSSQVPGPLKGMSPVIVPPIRPRAMPLPPYQRARFSEAGSPESSSMAMFQKKSPVPATSWTLRWTVDASPQATVRTALVVPAPPAIRSDPFST